MSPRIWERLLLSLGLLEEEEGHYKEDDDKELKAFSPKKKNVVSLHAMNKFKVVVLKPADYAAVEEAASHLKERCPVVVNLEETDLENARRIIDFLSGTIFALNGSLRKIGAKVFIFLPPNIELDGDLQDELAEYGFFLEDQKN
ncbi:MAG: cell division protein SepF [Dethiobacteria bacterium]|nr:cell division protein SepF [Bacillota bacterium]